jgi:4-hydroxybenzoate polyprenyltransferase
MTLAAAADRPSSRLRTYASFVRFEHTLFSLPLILAGIFGAPGPALSVSRWALIAVAAVGARTAAMALNRLIDRRLDALNPRTRVRELPSGAMKLVEAWALLVGSAAAYLLACAALGPWYLRVAVVPLAVFTLYPYLKRFTPLCHVGVGAALGLAPLAGFAAAHPGLESPWPAIGLAGFALLWVTGFDIVYATLDEAFDREHGVRSMVAWLGRERALRVSRRLHEAASLTLAAVVALVATQGPARPRLVTLLPSIVVWLAVAVLLDLEQRWAENVNLAFFKVNVWVGFGVLALVLVTRALNGGF